MGKNIALIVFTCVVALLGILINPKQDADKRFFKPTPMGYVLIVILFIIALFQILQLVNDRNTQNSERSKLVAHYKNDSLYQQKEINDRNKLIANNEELARKQDTMYTQEIYIVDLQKGLIQKSKEENTRVISQLNSLYDENKRQSFRIKPLMDISFSIPIDDYSVGRKTRFRIPRKKNYISTGKDPVFYMSADLDYFTDSLCLNTLQEIFGSNILILFEVYKPENSDDRWIQSVYRVELVEKPRYIGMLYVADWDASLYNELKEKKERKNLRTNFYVESPGNDFWKIRVFLYDVPIKLVGITPSLSFLDFTRTGTRYVFEHNSKLLNLDFSLMIKGDYGNYISEMKWESRSIESSKFSSPVGFPSQLKNVPWEKIYTKSTAIFDSLAFWRPFVNN